MGEASKSQTSETDGIWDRCGAEIPETENVGIVCSNERPSPDWMIIIVDEIPWLNREHLRRSDMDEELDSHVYRHGELYSQQLGVIVQTEHHHKH